MKAQVSPNNFKRNAALSGALFTISTIVLLTLYSISFRFDGGLVCTASDCGFLRTTRLGQFGGIGLSEVAAAVLALTLLLKQGSTVLNAIKLLLAAIAMLIQIYTLVFLHRFCFFCQFVTVGFVGIFTCSIESIVKENHRSFLALAVIYSISALPIEIGPYIQKSHVMSSVNEKLTGGSQKLLDGLSPSRRPIVVVDATCPHCQLLLKSPKFNRAIDSGEIVLYVFCRKWSDNSIIANVCLLDLCEHSKLSRMPMAIDGMSEVMFSEMLLKECPSINPKLIDDHVVSELKSRSTFLNGLGPISSPSMFMFIGNRWKYVYFRVGEWM